MSLTFNEQVKPMFKSKLHEYAAALTTTKMGSLDYDATILRIKQLLLELVGEDEKPTADDAFDTVRSFRQGRNDFRAELRKKINKL